MKKILNIMFLLTFCLCLGGCSREQRLTYEDEYFLYSYTINSYDENDDKYIYLIGLTEKGKDVLKIKEKEWHEYSTAVNRVLNGGLSFATR